MNSIYRAYIHLKTFSRWQCVYKRHSIVFSSNSNDIIHKLYMYEGTCRFDHVPMREVRGVP